MIISNKMLGCQCCSQKNKQKLFPEAIYYWFTTCKGTQLQEKLIEASECKDEDYPNWTRIKLKSKNVEEIGSIILKDNSHFIDEAFAHSLSNLTNDPVFATEKTQIEWKRVEEIVEKGIFQNANQDFQSLENYECKNRALRTALTLVSRTHPERLRRILCQRYSKQGLYEFKLLKDGIIHNVTIDDYIACFKGFPVFCGPTDLNEYYPMLLEKALAKVCGGYYGIPDEPLDIMEMIYCNILKKDKLLEIKNVEEVKAKIQRSLELQAMNLLVPKNQRKVQHSGINPGEIYHIIDLHQFSIQHEQGESQIALFQIISQNRLSSWNGPFRTTDPLWKQVPPLVKMPIFKRMQQNRSFCIQDTEVVRFFSDLLVYEDRQSLNKDWLINFSEPSYPSFSKFSLSQKEKIFIRISTKKAIEQRLMICQVLPEGRLRFSGGSFESQTKILEFYGELQGGEYLVCVIQEWEEKKENEYAIFLSSSCRTKLSLEKKHVHKFFESIFIEASNEKRKELSPVFYSCLQNVGIGYVRVFVRAPHSSSTIRINVKKLREENWMILEPFEEMREVVVTTDTLIGLKKGGEHEGHGLLFPFEAFIISHE